MGYWPERETFDYSDETGGRNGSLTGPVLNSFVNTPSYGDERYFFDGRRLSAGPGANGDTISLGDQPENLLLRIYVHNNANPAGNASGLAVAEGLRVRIELPGVTGTALQVVAALSAANIAEGWPSEVTDTVSVTAERPFSMAPVPGTARVRRGDKEWRLGDDIFGPHGALFDADGAPGRLTACFDHAFLVQAQIAIVPAPVEASAAPAIAPAR